MPDKRIVLDTNGLIFTVLTLNEFIESLKEGDKTQAP